MYIDYPKKLHEMRKVQLEKLKKARKNGKRAHYNKSEADKLYIDCKWVIKGSCEPTLEYEMLTVTQYGGFF